MPDASKRYTPPGVDPQPAQRALLPPQPVPMVWDVDQLVGPNGKVMIGVQVQTPVGVSCYFMDRDMAGKIGAELVKLAEAGELILAKGG